MKNYIFFLFCSICVGSFENSYAQSVGSIGGSAFTGITQGSKEEVIQGGGFLTYTSNNMTFALQLMAGTMGGSSVQRYDFNGSITFRIYSEYDSKIGFFIGIKTQRFQAFFQSFNGYGPSVGFIYSQSSFFLSGAYVRTFGDFEDNIIVASGGWNFPFGDSGWGGTIGYRAEILPRYTDANIHGVYFNLWHALR